MEEKKLKAMFFNGSPRKNKNTADMLQSAMRGAEAVLTIAERGQGSLLLGLRQILYEGWQRGRILHPAVDEYFWKRVGLFI